MTQSPSNRQAGNVVRLSGLLSIALGVFGLLVGALIMYTSIQGQLDSEQASNAAGNQARSIGDSLAEVQAAIQNPQVIGLARDLLQEGRLQSDALEAAVQRRGVANIIDLKVFPAEVESIQLGDYPEPDFTVIEMLLQARAEGQAPIQVHYPNQAIENLALAQAVEVDSGVEGIIFLRVPVSMVSSLLEVSRYIDYIGLVQGRDQQAYTLRNLGDKTGPVDVTPIPGSRLSLHWTRRTFASAFSKQAAVIILSIGIILLMVGLLIRQRFGALNTQALSINRAKRTRTQADDESRSDDAKPASTPVTRKAPSRPKRKSDRGVAAKRKKPPEPPVVDDLPDWLLDSDQIDQTNAPLDGGDEDLPELPDTLSDRVDDTAASAGGSVTDTLVFNSDDEGAEEHEDGPPPDAEPRPNGSKSESGDSDPAFLDASGAAAETEDPESDIDWDDFNSEIESEELLSGRDEKAIDDALADLEEPEPEPSVPDNQGDSEDTDTPSSSDQPSEPVEAKQSGTDKQMSGEPVLDASLFRANSIGGIFDEHLDSRAATLIGEAIGSEAASQGVERMVVGRDGRLEGPVLMSALSQGLRSAGIDVVDIGAVPIPVFNFAATELTSGNGVMVTGSHYPAGHNGFRTRIQNKLLTDSAIRSIQRRIDTQDLTSGSGRLEEENVIERYIERIGIDVQLERPLKVVVDCGNGIAGSVVPTVLSAIGADVIPLYADVDGSFPNHLPDPSQPENLEDLKLCVRNFNADLGLAFDGDGDRLAAISGDGQVIWTDRVLMLLMPDIIERNAGTRVVVDSASSLALHELIQAAGGKPVVERSAEAFIEQRMRKESALLGGLFSGHLFVSERWYPFDDAIYASARLLEVLAADTRPISEIIDQLPQAEGTPELRVPLEQERAEELITELIAEGDFGNAELSMVDGLRADYPDGWGMVRASHQGRGLVLRFEAESSKALHRIKTTFSRQIAARDSDVKLRF